MDSKLSLRTIHPGAVAAALDKARQYRLLGEPEQAESICLDILEIEPQHPDALKTLIMALTDQFARRSDCVRRARVRVTQLSGEYERLYYNGLILERDARAQLAKGLSAAFAHDLFMEAISFYERAESLRPEDNDDPILRRNSCLRTLWAEGLESLRPTQTDDEPTFE
jgi:tetratricopeptide (TPR) repeat protein